MSPVPVHREEAKHGLPGTFSGTQEVSEGRGACHILSHLERGFENKSPFVIHSDWEGMLCLSSHGLYRRQRGDENSSWPVGTIPSPSRSPVSTLSPASKACAARGTWSQALKGPVFSESLGHLLEGFLKLREGGGNHPAPSSPIQLPSLNLL